MLSKYSIGVGDRFGRQATAQLRACVKLAEDGVEVIPVWNKSNREHLIIGSEPSAVRAAADAAVRALGWTKPYHVDADHIRLETVDRFLAPSDFFTIDVADFIGHSTLNSQLSTGNAVQRFAERHPELAREIKVPGIASAFSLSRTELEQIAGKYLAAVHEAGRIYRYILKHKRDFITEVSMDETDRPQTPPELLVILAAIADEGIPIQTIAPKFTGRFNKGVDYAGDLAQFEKEFNDDLAVVAHAGGRYGLPSNLKLSIHSGSDKFSIYGPMRRAIERFNAGLHLKTAGTTWLEELIGLAEAGGDGLALAKEVYAEARDHAPDLCTPYAAVIDIDPGKLPPAKTVQAWSSAEYTAALRHDPKCPQFNPHVRQLLHVGYKVAAQMGQRYLKLLDVCEESIARNVTENLYQRHLKPLFGTADS
ncbi:MAG: tagaturonate epimerase family protein [Verrucomicrobia subdivision 3 bacterium]|nr:tagaturonate epimerase family protein [Limisphaerales bacterium]